MVFQGDMAIALTLIALSAGFLVLVKAKKQENIGTKTIGLIIGWVVIVVSAFTFLCASYYSLRYWGDGAYSHSRGMTMMRDHGMMGDRGMMGGSGMMAPGMMHGRMNHNNQCGPMGEQCTPKMRAKCKMPGMMNEKTWKHPGEPKIIKKKVMIDSTITK